MSKHRFNPIFLACASAVVLLGSHVNAQTTQSVNLMNNGSLQPGMSAQGARSYEIKQYSVGPEARGQVNNTPNAGTTANVGTPQGNTTANNGTGNTGASGGTASTGNNSGSNSSVTGTTQVANASQNQYNGNGQIVGTGGQATGNPAVDNGFMGPMQPGAGATTGASGGADWLRIIQIAAPIVASVTGNQQIGQIAGIVGSGAQVYGALSTGQELTAQNYANIGNIALQTAALATNDPNIDRAARLGTIGLGAVNTYTALTSNRAQTGGVQVGGTPLMVPVGQTATGQVVYQAAHQQEPLRRVPLGPRSALLQPM